MRKWIWKALCAVVLQKAYSNLYLKDHLDELPLKDRGLAARIFYGTLQNYALCQAAWKPYVQNKINPKLAVLLTFSVYQLLFLDKVPAYAIIDEAVSLAKKQSGKLGGFVNAVLRRVLKDIEAIRNEAGTPDVEKLEVLTSIKDPVEKLAVRYSLPVWLPAMWKAQYGMEQAEALAKSSVDTLPVYVRINPLLMDETEHAKLLAEGRLVAVNPEQGMGLDIYPGTGLGSDPLYMEGKISAMDPGSYAIACFGKPAAGEMVLDVCAAPGTKTNAMAELMNNEGHILAHDLHEHRVKLIEQDAARLHTSMIEATAMDSTALPASEQACYDLVLCDVPCSGYGVLARKPDMKLNLNSGDMDELIPLQKKILESAATCVKENGRLVYSTCTLNKKENEKQVEAFLASHPAFELEEQQTLFADENHDGFYMARLRRKA